MIARIHQKLGTAGFVISIVALVAALCGGAYAAGGGLTGKQKKEVTKIAKKYAGKPGAPGATGPAGPAGAKGDNGAAGANGKDGTNGTDGTDGTNGTSVTTASIPTSSSTCNHNGGVEVKSASPAQNVCNGQTGFTETLPPGKTETGTWVFGPLPEEKEFGFLPISFPIPLAENVQAHVLDESASPTEECPGSNSEPIAAKGNLCLYELPTGEGVAFTFNGVRNPEGGTSNVGKVGALLSIQLEKEARIQGTWAVTAP